MDPQSHWEAVYRGKGERETSWFREHLDTSLALIDGLALDPATPVIDVGGGRSTLVDDLLARGYTDLSVLDLSESALAQARERLGAAGATVAWHVADVVDAALPDAHYGLWHDRAVFHFLVDDAARAAYVAQAARSVRPGGYAIIATFAPDGPEKCSGLPVRRQSAAELAAALAPQFAIERALREEHATPWGTTQSFTWVVLVRVQ
ncbi:MAG TPA: class I SAM-dependent methyltransferase [Pseudomonadota bacterium]|nr:class I SAM-dependent methyltransferase [Pseudomonadota bacterium]